MSELTRKDIKPLQTVYGALMIGVIFFMVIAVFVNLSIGPLVTGDIEFMNLMLIAALAISGFMIPAGILYFNKQMRETGNLSIAEKLESYRSAIFVRAALFEAASAFCAVSYLLFGHYIFGVLTIACLIVFAIHFPTKGSIEKSLKLRD